MKVGFGAKDNKDRMKKYRRVIAITIILMCVMTSNTYAYGIKDEPVCGSHKSVEKTMYSPEFPDAYILSSKKNTWLGNGKIQNEISATVFVEETIEIIDGHATITESRLLSEAEVIEIGEDNFKDLPNATLDLSTIPEKIATRGKLTISFMGYSQLVGNGITINCGGTAHWNGYNFLYSPENNPAVGNDFFGIVWPGDYWVTNHSFSVYWNVNPGMTLPTYYHPFPTSGAVYEFPEYCSLGAYDDRSVRDADIAVTLQKNTLTGNGNLAEIVMQYIHTYEALTYSYQLTFSDAPVGFSLSSVAKQWTLKTEALTFPY